MSHNPVQTTHHAHQLVENLAPPPAENPTGVLGRVAYLTKAFDERAIDEKNPWIAFVLGVLFGALSVAIYFRSLKDFFVCLFLLVFLTFAIPAAGAVPGWLFAGFYGAYRAYSYNQKHHNWPHQ